MAAHETKYDQLEMARDRTILANERTFLAYSNSALGLIGAALVIFKFAEPNEALIFGSIAFTAAFFVFFWGVHHYRVMAAKINEVPSERISVLAEADL